MARALSLALLALAPVDAGDAVKTGTVASETGELFLCASTQLQHADMLYRVDVSGSEMKVTASLEMPADADKDGWKQSACGAAPASVAADGTLYWALDAMYTENNPVGPVDPQWSSRTPSPSRAPRCVPHGAPHGLRLRAGQLLQRQRPCRRRGHAVGRRQRVPRLVRPAADGRLEARDVGEARRRRLGPPRGLPAVPQVAHGPRRQLTASQPATATRPATNLVGDSQEARA